MDRPRRDVVIAFSRVEIKGDPRREMFELRPGAGCEPLWASEDAGSWRTAGSELRGPTRNFPDVTAHIQVNDEG